MKFGLTRAATSLAAVATLTLAGVAASSSASAAPDDSLPGPEVCYMQVPGSEGHCVPACHGLAPTVGVPAGGATFYAPPGPQVIVGTDGDDRIFADDDDDVICGRDGIDTIYAGGGDDIVYGDGNADQIYGEDDDDFILGGGGGDVLSGGDNDDILWGEGNADGLGCGRGVDTVDGGAGQAIDFILPNSGVCETITRVEVV
jgi:hypothetical protein